MPAAGSNNCTTIAYERLKEALDWIQRPCNNYQGDRVWLGLYILGWTNPTRNWTERMQSTQSLSSSQSLPYCIRCIDNPRQVGLTDLNGQNDLGECWPQWTSAPNSGCRQGHPDHQRYRRNLTNNSVYVQTVMLEKNLSDGSLRNKGAHPEPWSPSTWCEEISEAASKTLASVEEWKAISSRGDTPGE